MSKRRPPVGHGSNDCETAWRTHPGEEIVCDEAAHAVGDNDARLAVLSYSALDEPLQPGIISHLARKRGQS